MNQNFNEKINKFILTNKYEKFLNFRNIENYKNINSNFVKQFEELYKEKNLLQSMYNFDINNTLPLSYNKALDLGSMRSSLEVRSPFLNKKIFNFLRSFDNEIFFKGSNKEIFKEILLDYIPLNLIPISKIGFNYPLSNIYQSINFKNLNSQIKNIIIFLKDQTK